MRACVCLLLICMGNAASAQLTANFSANQTIGCPGLTVNFTDLTTGGPTAWEWDLGNGNPAYVQNAGAVYDDPGFYTVTLIVTNGTFTDTLVWPNLIEIITPPVPDFSASDSTGCQPFAVSFNNLTTSIAGIASTAWDFGDGNGSAASDPSHTYQFADSMSVTLTIIDTMGCQATTTKPNFIDVDYVAAAFSLDTLTCNLPANVNFTDGSSGDGLSWEWDLGYGNSSTDQHPVQGYTAFDTLDVTLSIMSAYGCTDTLTQPLLLTDYQADFTYSVQCLETGIIMDYFPSANLTMENWFWTLGDGTPSGQVSPSWFYPGYGPYTIQLISHGEGNCIDTVTHTYEPPQASFTVDTFYCDNPMVPVPTNTTIGSGVLDYLWKIGNTTVSTDSNPAISYSVPDTVVFADYNFTLVTTNQWGCADTAITVLEYSRPFMNIAVSKPDGGCIPLNVTFSDSSAYSSPLVAWEWDFGDGSSDTGSAAIHTYTDTGHFDITLIVTTQEGCLDTMVFPSAALAGIPPDTVDFTFFPGNPICRGTDVQYISNASFADTTIQPNTWYWPFLEVFEDPNDLDITKPNPFRNLWMVADTEATIDTIEFYHLAGYNGCMDTAWQTMIIFGPERILGFSTDSITTDLFGSCGNPLLLEVKPQGGAFDTVVLFQLVDVISGATTPLNPDTTSHLSLVGPASYNLQFIGATFPDTSLTFPSCTGGDFQSRITIDSSSVGFVTNVVEACLPGNAFEFIDTTYSRHGKVDRWTWAFGDGDSLVSGDHEETIYYVTSDIWLGGNDGIKSYHNHDGRTVGTYSHPTHTYQDTGTYTVSCQVRIGVPHGPFTGTAYDTLWCNKTAYSTIRVHNIYTAFEANQLSGCRDSTFFFSDTSTSTGPIVDWQWTFFDSLEVGTDTTQFPEVAFSTIGNYSAELVTTNEAGCKDTLAKYLYVEATWPTALGNTPTPVICAGDSALFLNTSFGANPAYTWDFDDGSSSTNYNAWHTFQDSGWHHVSITAVDINSCTDVYFINDSVYVSPIPIADFEADTIITPCAPLPVIFADSSWGNLAAWDWDFGDGSSSTNINPTHTYTQSGEYDVTLAVTTTDGCRDTIYRSNYVHVGGPDGSVSFFPDSICAPDSVHFVFNTENTALITWDFGDGNVQDIPLLADSGSHAHVYDSAGTKNPVVILEDPDGCRWIIPSTETIFADRVYASFVASDTVLCDSSQVFFSNQTSSAYPVTPEWDFGNGQTSTDQNPIVGYTSTGNYTVTLSAEGPYCTGQHSKTIEVMLQPDVIIEPSAFRACVPGEVLFGGINLNPEAEISGWEWFVNGELQQIDSLVSLEFDSTGWQVVKLRGYYSNGQCFSDTTFTIWGAATPVADFDYSPKIPAVRDADIAFTDQSINTSQWSWDFGDGSSSETEHPMHRYEFGGIHPVMLIAEDEFECSDTIIKLVQVIPRIANVFTPNGDGFNDTYFVMERLDFTRFDLTIFNRWGQELYFTNDYDQGWDGYYEGQQAPDGVYFWDLWFNFDGNPGNDMHLTGNVHLFWGPGNAPPTRWIWEKE